MGLIFVRWSSDMHVAHWCTLGGVHSTLVGPTQAPRYRLGLPCACSAMSLAHTLLVQHRGEPARRHRCIHTQMHACATMLCIRKG